MALVNALGYIKKALTTWTQPILFVLAFIAPLAAQATPSETSLSLEATKAIGSLTEILRAAIAKDTTIREALSVANREHASISPEKIKQLDQSWIDSKGITALVKRYLTSPCSERLLDLQHTFEGFSEIFITDAKGLNVCQTNRTSDLYQADEEWWQKSFSQKHGTAYFGAIEYDESAGSESIPIYLTITADDGESVLGICKAVVDITAIKDSI